MKSHLQLWLFAIGLSLATATVAWAAAADGQPDVLGFRIGMTPAEARAVIKSRPALPIYQEQPASLTFLPPGGYRQEPLPGGDYLAAIWTEGRLGTLEPGQTQQLNLQFSPVPGRERLVGIHRSENLPEAKKPTYAVLLESLQKKYGAPTYWSATSPNTHVWSFDASGKNRPPSAAAATPGLSPAVVAAAAGAARDAAMAGGGPSKSQVLPPVPCLNVLLVGSARSDQWPVNPKSLDFNAKPADVVRQCGSTIVQVLLMFKGGNFRGPDTIVDYIDVVMIGLADAYRDGGVVEGIISGAMRKAESAEVKAGQQQRPEL